MVQKNDIIEVGIESLAYGGRPVGKLDGLVVFVDGAVPGDRVKARIIKKKRDYAEALTDEVLESSPHRTEPRCPHFGQCGGCAMQHIEYDEQLRQKAEQVGQVLARVGKQKELVIDPICPSPVIWRYRNKMDFTFGVGKEGEVVLGMHRRGRFASIVDIEHCWLQPESFDRVLEVVRGFARRSGRPAYDTRSHKGFWRHLILRHSVAEDRLLAVLITATGEFPDIQNLVDELVTADVGLAGFVWATNDSVADVASCQVKRYEWGEPVLREKLGELEFRVSPMSFFQVNTRATEGLYTCVAEFAEGNSAVALLDAYCGTGSIGIFCADRFRMVVGIESIREAVWDARENAAANGLSNCRFLCGPVKRLISLARTSAGGRFGRVVVDPPRGGMDKKALARLLDLRAEILIYVSCNPATLARDVVAIADAGYEIERVRPFDLFPHTPHIESVIRFKLV